jgi:osmotically-inducible protein OsmY
MVRLLAEAPEFQENEEARSMLADELIKSRVRAALGASISPVTVSVAKGKVTLTGATMTPIPDVDERVRAIPGVTDVENDIVILRSGTAA